MDVFEYAARKYNLYRKIKALHSRRLEKYEKKQAIGRFDRIHFSKEKELLTRLVDKYNRRILAIEASDFGDFIVTFHHSTTLHYSRETSSFSV